MVETSFEDSLDLVNALRTESQHSLVSSHLSTSHPQHYHSLLHRPHQHSNNSYSASASTGSLIRCPMTSSTNTNISYPTLEPIMSMNTGVDLEQLGSASAGLMSPVDSSSWSSISTPSPRSPTFEQANINLASFDSIGGRVDFVQRCVATKTKPGCGNNNNNKKDDHQHQRSLFTKHRISSMLHNKRCSSSLSRTPSPPNILQSTSSPSLQATSSHQDNKLCKVCGAPGLGKVLMIKFILYANF